MYTGLKRQMMPGMGWTDAAIAEKSPEVWAAVQEERASAPPVASKGSLSARIREAQEKQAAEMEEWMSEVEDYDPNADYSIGPPSAGPSAGGGGFNKAWLIGGGLAAAGLVAVVALMD